MKLIQSDPLVGEYFIAVKEPETVSRFLGNFNYKTTQMLREVIFRLLCKLLWSGPENNRPGQAQLSFLPGEEFECFFFVTNTDLPVEAVVAFYQKRGNAENYIKEAKYHLAIGHLLLRSFWANDAIFQLMMKAYNLFLLLKMDWGMKTEYRQQITCA